MLHADNELEEICVKGTFHGKVHYLFKWVGKDERDWVPAADVAKDLKKATTEFNQKIKREGIPKMRQRLSDLGGRIASCCTASEEGLVLCIPEIGPRPAINEAVVALDDVGARAEDVEGMAQPGVDNDMLFMANRISAAALKKKKRNKRTKNQTRNRTTCSRCKVLGHYRHECPDKPLVG